MFNSSLEYLSSKDGLFVPIFEILDFVQSQLKKDNEYTTKLDLIRFDIKWIISSIKNKILTKR